MTKDQKKVLRFIDEIDKAKYILRKIHVDGGKRFENDAEHSFSTAMIVWLFADSFEEKLDLEKALKMTLMHDLVEIYAGDTYLFDQKARLDKKEREDKAAKQLFEILPTRLQKEFFNLWKEYEDRKTAEARFVQAMDKLQPIIQNILVEGKSWKEFGASRKMIKEHKLKFVKDSKFLLTLFKYLLKDAQKKGYLN